MRTGRAFVSLLVAAGLLLGGCAQKRASASGFLGNVQQLEKTGRGGDMAYIDKGADWSGYYEMVIDPITISPPPGEKLRVTPKEQEELRGYLQQALVESLRHRYTVTTEPGPGAVRVRAALTEVGQALPWFNIPAAILAYPVDYGGASIEVEILDYKTNKRVAALIASRTGDLSQLVQHFTWLGHARRSIYRATDRLRIMVDEAAAPADRPILKD